MPFESTDGSHSFYLSQFERKRIRSLVKWHSWGKKSLQDALDKDKLVFLSIGCSSSHWCHVMDMETFNNEVVAYLLNDSFVCIKVDRDEHPDIATKYMRYLQFLEGSQQRSLDNWKFKELKTSDKRINYPFHILDDMPLNVFLSPDLYPLFGASYLSPDHLALHLSFFKEAWVRQEYVLRRTVAHSFHDICNALPKTATLPKLRHWIEENALYLCANELVSEEFIGLGSAFKFFRPVGINLMFYFSKTLVEAGDQAKANKVLKVVFSTLQCMAKSGLHDHIGGGFHRIGSRFRKISTPDLLEHCMDECPVPHFEKMLYDQGQLASVYLTAFSIRKNLSYSRVSRDILDFLRSSMMGQCGEFFSAVGAGTTSEDEKLKEGAFYQWSAHEVEHELGSYAGTFWHHYDLQSLGTGVYNEFKGRHVLIEAGLTSKFKRPEYTLGKCREMLFKRRSQRPRPDLDETVIVSWNGLVISSFARASKILLGGSKVTKFNFPVSDCDPEEYLQVAEKAAQFIKDNLFISGKLCHSWWNDVASKVSVFLDDYAFLISGLLDLYEFGGGLKWLKWAIELQDIQVSSPSCFCCCWLDNFTVSLQDELFLDRGCGGYYTSVGGSSSLELEGRIYYTLIEDRMKDYYDGAVPSGNSVSAINLVRLKSMFCGGSSSDRYEKTAQHLLAVFETKLKDRPTEVPLMCCAADMLSEAQTIMVVLFHHGQTTVNEFNELLAAAHASYDPNKIVIHIDLNDGECVAFWEKMVDPFIPLLEFIRCQIRWPAERVYSPVAWTELVGCHSFYGIVSTASELVMRMNKLRKHRKRKSEHDLVPCKCSVCNPPRELCSEFAVKRYGNMKVDLEKVKVEDVEIKINDGSLSCLNISIKSSSKVKFKEAREKVWNVIFQYPEGLMC